MTLYLDCSARDEVVFGLRKRRVVVLERHPVTFGKRERILPLLERFLQRRHYSPSALTRIVVFAGPGQFSGLRTAAVIANTFAAVYGVSLAVITGTPPSATDDLRAALARSKIVPLVQPHYGTPPHITRPSRQ